MSGKLAILPSEVEPLTQGLRHPFSRPMCHFPKSSSLEEAKPQRWSAVVFHKRCAIGHKTRSLRCTFPECTSIDDTAASRAPPDTMTLPNRPFAHQHLPRGIHAHHMQDRLCHVAPQYARILFHRTRRLLSGMMVSNAAMVWLLEAMLPTQVHGMSADQSGIHHGIKWLSGAMPRPHETDKAFPLHTGSMGRLGHAQQSRGRRPILTIRDNNYATSTTTVGPCCVPAQSPPQGQ